MPSQELLDYIDNLVFSNTGKHLDNLQFSILTGVLNGKKYPDIAKDYNCSKGHVKDKAYELWNILSKVLGENINKSNFSATIKRLGFSNCQSIIGHKVRVDSMNFCPNSSKEEPAIINDDFEEANQNNGSQTQNHYKTIIEQTEKKTKLETIPKLVKIGLTAEQIAEMLELPLNEVEEIIIL
jgi:hypothetical protein